MNDENDNNLRELLKRHFPPVQDTELRRDLWPELLEKISGQPVHVPWFDWALAALAGAAVLIFPAIIPALFYHL